MPCGRYINIEARSSATDIDIGSRWSFSNPNPCPRHNSHLHHHCHLHDFWFSEVGILDFGRGTAKHGKIQRESLGGVCYVVPVFDHTLFLSGYLCKWDGELKGFLAFEGFSLPGYGVLLVLIDSYLLLGAIFLAFLKGQSGRSSWQELQWNNRRIPEISNKKLTTKLSHLTRLVATKNPGGFLLRWAGQASNLVPRPPEAKRQSVQLPT